MYVYIYMYMYLFKTNAIFFLSHPAPLPTRLGSHGLGEYEFLQGTPYLNQMNNHKKTHIPSLMHARPRCFPPPWIGRVRVSAGQSVS